MNELQMMDNNPNQKQRKVDNQRIKQEYKSKAETALDNVVRLWNNAKINIFIIYPIIFFNHCLNSFPLIKTEVVNNN